jgi:lactoylglutathione lyase
MPGVIQLGISDMPENRLVPELSVSDLNKSLHFYRDILGFKVEFERPEDRFAYMSFYGSELMIEEDYKRDGDGALWIVEPLDYPRGRGLNISIDCPSTRDLIERLKGAGVPLRKPVEDCWYRNNDILHGQRNFLVQDPDGYLLRFAESLGTKPFEKFVV